MVEAYTRGEAGKFADDQVIRMVVKDNPKQVGSASYTRFSMYRHGMTVGEYRRLCKAAKVTAHMTNEDLRWDTAHNFISIR